MTDPHCCGSSGTGSGRPHSPRSRSVVSALALLGFLLVPGTRLDLVSDALGIIVAALFLVLVVSIQHASTKEQRMITHLGLIFAVIYLVAVSMNNYLRLTVVQHLPIDGGTAVLFGFRVPRRGDTGIRIPRCRDAPGRAGLR